MRRIIILLCFICSLVFLTSCTETKTLTCDGCGTKVEVESDSNMEEDWIIYCKPCQEELFKDDPLLGV